MEFLFIPLLAIAAVTFSIYKLAELVFHIRLSCRLLVLLVGFAWLISLVLPGLFFHSAGFWGSVGLSLVSAVGFAWLATVFDSRTQASHRVVSLNGPAQNPEPDSEKVALDEFADYASNVREESIDDIAAIAVPAMEIVRLSRIPTELPLMTVEVLPEQSDLAPQICEKDSFVPDQSVMQDGEPDVENVSEQPATGVMLSPEDKMIVDETDVRDAIVEKMVISGVVEEEEPELPATDSLEDLLEFAFTQRSRLQKTNALNTFLLIKHLYGESDALPMIVAEIVNILQNQGDYAGAKAELKEILQMPAIRKQEPLVRVFEQKLMELQEANGVMAREQQEQRFFAGDRMQS
ncbi:MAG: hypothetical protein AB9917_12000 [Negativicutes bacterium]